jgi:3-deoxy-D-manno-octulosonic-acid transferase
MHALRRNRKLYNRFVYWLYSLLLFLVLIGSTPWWLLQMWRHGKYRSGWGERLGKVPDRLRHATPEATIWVHAVSVGEVLAMTRVIERLKAELPRRRIIVSTTTDTGQKLARERFGNDNVFRLPLDLPFAVRPYFAAFRPQLLILAESEFWPNLLRWAKRSGASVAVVNARISDRSFSGYRRFRRLLQPMMHDIDLLLAQSDEDVRRLLQIGAPSERVHLSGNLKFEVNAPARSALTSAFAEAIPREEIGPVIVAGSTLEGEEAMLIEMFQQVRLRYAKAVLVLAPRHPERFDRIAALVSSSGIPYQRRSHWNGSIPIHAGVFLLDSIGELASLYEVADLAFIGGSLVPRGGHNVVEAAQFGKAILVGPHTENFRDIIEIFQRADALRIVTPHSLTSTVLQLLRETATRGSMGTQALAVMHSQRGATEKTVSQLLRLLNVEMPVAALESEQRA